MLRIIKNNKSYDLEYEGIKIINCDNTTQLYKKWFVDSLIQIDNKTYKQDDIIYISELTTINQFFNFTKKSFLLDLINNEVNNDLLVNNELVKSIVEKINKMMKFDLLIQCEGDRSKIVQLLFETLDNIFFDEQSLEAILKYLTKQKLFIFDNVSWLKIDLLQKYLNNHNFIILSSDFRKVITNWEAIELVVNVKKDDNFIEFSDSKILLEHLEKEMCQQIDDKKIDDFFKKNDSLFSLQLFSKIKLI